MEGLHLSLAIERIAKSSSLLCFTKNTRLDQGESNDKIFLDIIEAIK